LSVAIGTVTTIPAGCCVSAVAAITSIGIDSADTEAKG
jgi:hypothetical protein